MITKRETIELSTVATIVSLIVGGWFYMDSHFASASEVSMIASTLEQSTIQLRIDILEDRIDREADRANPNDRSVEKMQGQIRRLELRQEALINQEMQ